MNGAKKSQFFIALALWAGASGLVVAQDKTPSSASSSNNHQHVMVLAGSCAACHGTSGNALAGNQILAGMSAQDFITKMHEFRSDKRASTVMHRHAKGLTEAEIEQLAMHFSAQHPQPASLPKHIPPQGR